MNWVDFVAIVPYYVTLVFNLLDLDPGLLSSLRIIRVLRLARVLKVISKAGGGAEPSIDDGDDEDVGAVIGEIVANSGGALVIPLYFMLLALIVFASLEYYIERVEEFDAVLSCTNLTDVPNSCERVMRDNHTGAADVAECPALGFALENCTTTTYYHVPGEFETDGFDEYSSDFYASIPESFWWCIVTMTTVGYGDKFPLSWLGQIIATCTAAVGIFFISMPLAIVGSSFASSCDKLVAIQAQKDAVKASEAHGYGSLSYLSKSHAVLIVRNVDMEKNITEIENIVAEDVGNFDKDEANDTFELILDLREKQTLFTSVIHKELFLKRLKDNLAKATYDTETKEIVPFGKAAVDPDVSGAD